MFDGRLDLLERRLRELTGEVFAFVIVEILDEDKPQPELRAQWRRIKQFARQIRYVVVPGSNAPATETHINQRFAENLPRGLMDANADDVVLISDTGSIPEIRLIEHAEASGHLAFVFHANKLSFAPDHRQLNKRGPELIRFNRLKVCSSGTTICI